MRKLIFILALVGCSDDKKPTPDAAIEAPALTLDCNSYCTNITANCTGANAQYPDMAHCMGTCSKFPVGALTDTGGQNTLGCRLYHSQNAAKPGQTPEVHCPHAGPGGAAISNAADTLAGVCGDPCTSFCTLEIATCGSLDTPIAGITAQYQNAAACMTSCGTGTTGYSKANTYSLTAMGDSLACRLYHVTNAAVSAGAAAMHCPHTGPGGGPSAGTCMAGTPPGP
jgi:hypothetical protein